MTQQRFKNGAFVFSRARGVEPRTPEELEPVLARHGIERSFLPEYAGDRMAVSRAISDAKRGLSKDGYLLRPIKRGAGHLVFGIVRETKDVMDQRLDHEFEATVSWTLEPDPTVIIGDHPVAQRVAESYRALRGKITAEDWSGAVTQHLEASDAARVRSGVFWVPPQTLDGVRKLGRFLEDVGIDLVICEVDQEAATVVRSAAGQNLDEQLDRLQAEVDGFDGSQKPSTYARRLEEFGRLRARANLYRDALGVGVDRAESVLAELERKVSEMFELRSNTVVHRDGYGSSNGSGSDAPSAAPAATRTVLRFAGARFTHASTDDGTAVFTSDDATARAQIATLAQLGLAGRWQEVGQLEVSLQNSGPPGAAVSIQVRIPHGHSLESCAASLRVIGIDVDRQPGEEA